MKSKTKFDPKVLQQFFIDHTEKFVLGLVAVLFLFFAYQSYGDVTDIRRSRTNSRWPRTPP